MLPKNRSTWAYSCPGAPTIVHAQHYNSLPKCPCCHKWNPAPPPSASTAIVRDDIPPPMPSAELKGPRVVELSDDSEDADAPGISYGDHFSSVIPHGSTVAKEARKLAVERDNAARPLGPLYDAGGRPPSLRERELLAALNQGRRRVHLIVQVLISRYELDEDDADAIPSFNWKEKNPPVAQDFPDVKLPDMDAFIRTLCYSFSWMSDYNHNDNTRMYIANKYTKAGGPVSISLRTWRNTTLLRVLKITGDSRDKKKRTVHLYICFERPAPKGLDELYNLRNGDLEDEKSHRSPKKQTKNSDKKEIKKEKRKAQAKAKAAETKRISDDVSSSEDESRQFKNPVKKEVKSKPKTEPVSEDLSNAGVKQEKEEPLDLSIVNWEGTGLNAGLGAFGQEGPEVGMPTPASSFDNLFDDMPLAHSTRKARRTRVDEDDA
ncbi:unnamed protein product [Zymoseptoria tritici ST99CH_1A5]|uniref:Uncharacterized protein n=1 Tax=Zymoseptoria tritici ST99CH_1A5 TaxID=1276529 RepID=A0A1Y6L8F4_ZYMTR|nr:unnamed protein product [Zymoseptoria tritici ST99CH_1A5]